MKPLVLINFKSYKESTGNKALDLAKNISKISKSKKDKYEVVIAPSLLTIKEISQKVNLTFYSQHSDRYDFGAHTGSASISELKSIGVTGTILNHSERKIPFSKLAETIEICKRKRIKTVVCASTLIEIKRIAPLKPTYIAYEPKEFIGSNISVTEAKPEIILRAVDIVKHISPRTKVLCGAGIHNKEDVGHALVLGTAGVLISHAVVRAKDPKKFLESMLM